MRKFLLFVAIAAAVPAITFTFTSCKKKDYTCVCDGYYYTVTAISRSKAETACEVYGFDCYLE